MGRIGIGLIGLASRSQYEYADWFSENPYSKVVAVSDENKQTGMEAAQRYSAEWHSDFNTLLSREDVDAVCICSENVYHAKQVLTSIRAKKHVLCDNPLALTLKDCDKIIGETKNNGVKLFVPFRPRLNAALSQLKSLVEDDTIGDLRAVYFLALFPRSTQGSESWLFDHSKSGGGCILNVGSHAIDYALWLTKKKPERIYAVAKGKTNEKTENGSVITIRFEKGPIVTIVASWLGGRTKGSVDATAIGEMVVDLIGYKRIITMDAYHQKLDVYGVDQDKEEQIYWGMPDSTLAVTTFLNSIVRDEEIHPDGQDAKVSLELVLAAYKSVEVGSPVKM